MISHANGGPGLTSKPIKIRWEGGKSVAENAGEKLPELARGFFEAGRELGPQASFKDLHRFRLLTKRFRYTLELFRPCYGPALERRIEALQTLQQDLGEVSDCASTEAMLLDRDDLPKAEKDRLVRKVRDLAAARTAKFQRHWRADFAPRRREREWVRYLKSCRYYKA